MTQFKFLNTYLVKTEDGHYIQTGEWFYSVNKEIIISPRSKKKIPKYTIVSRYIPHKFKHIFKPDHNILWYFKERVNAYNFINQHQ